MDRKNLVVLYIHEVEQKKIKIDNLKMDVLKEQYLDTDDDDDEDEELIVSALGTYGETPPRIKNYVERIVSGYNSVEFQQNFRMSREAFDTLCRLMNQNIPSIQGGTDINIDLEKQLLAVIWLLATPESYRSVGDRFDMAKSTLSVVFFRIINMLNTLAPTFIKFPTRAQKEESQQFFENKYRLKGVIGAVDGSYIPCKAPAEQKMAYTNRKMFTAVTLQAICDQNMLYIDCFIGFPSSVHDNRIFRNSDFYKNVQANVTAFFENGEKILGDKAYPVESWCIPPYIDRGNLTDEQKKFNTVHASGRYNSYRYTY